MPKHGEGGVRVTPPTREQETISGASHPSVAAQTHRNLHSSAPSGKGLWQWMIFALLRVARALTSLIRVRN